MREKKTSLCIDQVAANVNDFFVIFQERFTVTLKIINQYERNRAKY